MPEATLRRTDVGLVPKTAGWFVLNAREARWGEMGELGRYAPFEGEGDARFSQLGINVNVMQPGQPSSMYHAENAQEDFLVLAGEAILVVEGQERRLRQWDFVHCPAWTGHVIVGAGSGPCVFVAIGARTEAPEHVYPVSDAALRHGAGVSEETTSSEEAYRRFPRLVPQAYTDGDLT